jgi:SAM-dependent methyltransferase
MADGQRTSDMRRMLSTPAIYSLFQRVVGAERSRRLLVARHVNPRAGERVLDLGCGTAELLDVLPPVDYLGFDINPRYIDAARQRYGSRGRFECADIRDADISGEQPFDLVLAVGLLHHLDDQRVRGLLALAASALVPSGRLVTFDGVFAVGQPRAARWLIEHDRGQQVRTVDGYRRLVDGHFATVELIIGEDFLRIPYTHLVVKASGPQPA